MKTLLALAFAPLVVTAAYAADHNDPNSINAIFSRLVDRGITATNGRSSRRAKYASLIAVDPDDASTIVVPWWIWPLHNA